MSSRQEFVLFLCLGVLGLCASQVIQTQLRSVKKACKITRTETSEYVSTRGSEDAIKIETLDELSNNANEDIRNAAIKIVTERASKSSARYILLRDLRSMNSELREKALTTMKYLRRSAPGCFDADKHTVIQSLIGCLINLLPLSQQFEKARMLGTEIYRTQAECDALELMFLFMTQFGRDVVIECNIFDLWLARYPFRGDFGTKHPGDEDSWLAEQQGFIRESNLGHEHDHLLNLIIGLTMGNKKTYKGLSDDELPFHGIHDEDAAEDEERYSRIWHEVHGTTNAPDPGLGPMMRRGYRVREESVEEQALRRRRREAMVLGEMGRPIQSEDIIQRVGP